MINEKKYVEFVKWVNSHSIEYLELMYNVELTWYQKIFIKYLTSKNKKGGLIMKNLKLSYWLPGAIIGIVVFLIWRALFT